MSLKIYLTGSMRNPNVMHIANELREKTGYDIFEDWISPGELADDRWQVYERNRGRTYKEASQGHHARNVFEFDYKHLMESDAVVLVFPAGKSAHFEAGWFGGWYAARVDAFRLFAVHDEPPRSPRPVYLLLTSEPDRYDVMAPLFAEKTGGGIVTSVEELIEELSRHQHPEMPGLGHG